MTNTYCRGFSECARSHGVDSDALAKVAQAASGSPSIVDGLGDALGKVKDWYLGLDPNVRRGLATGAATGLGSYLFSGGTPSDRLLKSLLYGSGAGFGAYGLARSGYWNKGLDWLRDNIGELAVYDREGIRRTKERARKAALHPVPGPAFDRAVQDSRGREQINRLLDALEKSRQRRKG